MKQVLALCIIVLMVFSCAWENGKLNKRKINHKPFGYSKKNRKKNSQQKGLEKTKKEKIVSPSHFFSYGGKVYFPSIIHPNDQSEMVLINAGEYMGGSTTFQGKRSNPKNNSIRFSKNVKDFLLRDGSHRDWGA